MPLVKNGKTLLSGVDPVCRAERTADAVRVRDNTLYFCPSPLYGYGLARLLARLESEAPNSAVLCVEADGELYELTEKNIDPSFADCRKLRVTNICDAGGLCAFVREAWGRAAFRYVEIIRFSGGWQLFPELYDSLCGALRREIATDWSNALTLTKLGRLYIRNALRNLPLVPRFPSAANISFGEAPVLVLGAGPSLDETLDALKKRYSQILCSPKRPFKIVCVDTCLGSLKDRGINPDMAVILESQHWNLRDFTGCRGWKIPFAADLSALPASARILAGDGYMFMTPWTPLRIFERLKAAKMLPLVIPPLGSVGLTAVELSRRLTSGKIICAGLDFSFSQDKYHACGTPGHRGILSSQNRFRRIFNLAAYTQHSIAAVSKSGLSVYTSPAMKNYRDLFEQEFGGDSRIFDIEGSGLPLGIKTLSLEEAMTALDVNMVCKKPPQTAVVKNISEDKVALFFENEKKRLEELRNILSGVAAADNERLNVLIDECDYLWAHFPDCAGGRRPALNNISFLKRLRTEIDPAILLMER
ncbi:MAG: DUF115 domain-containing protein [Treponema sp.]|jgi:hypothetical protein|nr:DUF115 domain-containing protein [Treponema sp.]